MTSTSEWTGVKLSTLLEAVGVRREATWMLAEGSDAAGLDRSVPLTDEVLQEAMICYGQNGEALRPEQGYPLRLLLPGFEGNINVKWLRRLKLGSAPFMTRWETAKYTDLMPDGKAYQFSLVMEAKSVITSPSGQQQIHPGFHEIRGLAWSGRGRVTKVEVSSGRRTDVAERAASGAGASEMSHAIPCSHGDGMAKRRSCKVDASMRPAMSNHHVRTW